MAVALAAIGLGLSVLPVGAHAATVSVVTTPDGKQLDFAAAPGETNIVTALPGASQNSYTVTDTGGTAPTAGASCSVVNSTTVTCSTGGVAFGYIQLGDGNDDFTSGLGAGSYVYGGEGDDILRGSPNPELLDGGDGNDTLNGGGTTYDMFVGGAGHDVVTYATRVTAVSADPDGLWDDGQTGETDNIGTDVEEIVGGAGNDTLTGSVNADVLRGGGGADIIAGLDGADALYGDAGNDVIDAGAGVDTVDGGADDDAITSRDAGTADTVTCGLGVDTTIADFEDLLQGCETNDVTPGPDPDPTVDPTPTPTPTEVPTVTPDPVTPAPVDPAPWTKGVSPVTLAGSGAAGSRAVLNLDLGVLTVPLQCVALYTGDCTGVLRVTAKIPVGAKKATASRRGVRMRTVELAKARFKIKKGKVKIVRARVSRRGVSQVLNANRKTNASQRPKKIKARMSVKVTMPDGTTAKAAKPITVKIPAKKKRGR